MTLNVLIIAGLDPSGGAGVVADVRVAAEHGARPLAVATALTEQNTRGVKAANPAPAEVVGDQLRSLLSDIEVAAVKIGMLGTEAIAGAVADALALTDAPVVMDPVLGATAGGTPLYDGDMRAAVTRLAPHASLVTPNLDEASALAGARVAEPGAMRDAGEAIRALGIPAVLVKGGHLDGDPVDVLVDELGARDVRGERVGAPHSVHGTGCALSTAIACRLAEAASVDGAVKDAKAFVAGKLRAPATPGRGLASIF